MNIKKNKIFNLIKSIQIRFVFKILNDDEFNCFLLQASKVQHIILLTGTLNVLFKLISFCVQIEFSEQS